jgi:hypothetical protein
MTLNEIAAAEEMARGPNAQDAAEFVATNLAEALEVHGILTTALKDAGHLASETKPVEGSVYAILQELKTYLHSLPTTPDNLSARSALTELKARV